MLNLMFWLEHKRHAEGVWLLVQRIKGEKSHPVQSPPLYRYLALGIQDSSQKSHCMECVNVAGIGRNKTQSHMVGSAQWKDKALFLS